MLGGEGRTASAKIGTTAHGDELGRGRKAFTVEPFVEFGGKDEAGGCDGTEGDFEVSCRSV